MVENGKKFDTNKPPMALLDSYALEEVAKVLAFGAEKYDPHNWRGGIKLSRLLSAALRHIFKFIAGKNEDEETGLSPLAHAMCELMFALWMSKFRPDLDDRWKKEDN